MAVMTTSLMDKPSFEPKGPLAPSNDVMVLESNINGLAPSADALYPSDNTATENTAPPSIEEPLLNGKSLEDASTNPSLPSPQPAPVENMTSGIGPIAPFLPDKSDSDPITEVPPTIEPPTSDVRNEMDVEISAEAQNTANMDAMEITDEATSHSIANGVPDTTIPEAEAAAEPTEPTTTNGDITESSVVAGASAPSQQDAPASESIESAPAPAQDTVMEDVPSQSKVRPREEDEGDEEPSAKRTRTEEAEQTPAAPEPIPAADSTMETPAADATPVDASAQAAAFAGQYSPLLAHFDSDPLTDRQRAGLLKVLQGAKKAKPAAFFKLPVDYITLNIPTYPDLVKTPMDLQTMETKLKDSKYGSVDDFLADVSLIVRNTYTFNGPAHAVSQHGRSLESYMVKAVQTHATRSSLDSARTKSVPPPPEKKESRRRSTATKAEKPIVAPPAPTVASPTTYAPKDGVPIIRRDSTTNDGRPKREIQRPKPRDLPYSVKPRKKKFQIELKFCEMVLAEVKKQKYAKISWPFATPVDPVALNIPNYHKLIKKPMDMSTIEKKLKQGDYQTSKDFKNDFDLMFANCFKFNPENDDVHKMGKQFQEQVNEIWGTREEWITNHQPQSEPMSSAGEESDEEEDASEDEIDIRQRDLNDIQRQIAELTDRARNIIQSAAKQTSPKARGKKSGKAGKTSSKSKKVSSGGLGASKTKTKKPAKQQPPLSFEQKQEISESIGQLNENEMGKAMQIIRNGCPNLGGGNDEELEIDMEMIPEDVLRQLLRFVRSVRAPVHHKPEPISDDEFEPPKTSAAKSSKSKKNKPMNKKEQEDSIEAIKRQLETFRQPGGSGSEEPISPAMQDDSSSDDDADSESEEE